MILSAENHRKKLYLVLFSLHLVAVLFYFKVISLSQISEEPLVRSGFNLQISAVWTFCFTLFTKLRVLHVPRDLLIKHLAPTTVTRTEQPCIAVMCDLLPWKTIAEYLQVTEKWFSSFSRDKATAETKPEHTHFRTRQIPPCKEECAVPQVESSRWCSWRSRVPEWKRTSGNWRGRR